MDAKEHLVSLKVMRLLKPSLYSSLPVYAENEHFSENFAKLMIDQIFSSPTSADLNQNQNFSMSDFLVIPQIFGNLYIGETFTSYICLHNHSSFKVKQLNIKIELQTSSQKISLPFKSKLDGVDEFDPDQKFDGIVEYDVKELGNHILICIVNYLNEKSEKQSFKKFYKFVVSKPFEIQPRYPFMENQLSLKDRHSILFEAQIQNITNNLLFMENVKLQPLKPGVQIEEIKTLKVNSNDENVQYDKSAVLKPSEIVQYMFVVKYQDIDNEKKPLMVGKLDISWRYSMGEFGHLQTHPLEQPPEVNNIYNREIEISCRDLQKRCVVNELYVFECQVKNKSERELDLVMRLASNKSDGFIWNCNMKYNIGKLAPKAAFSLTLGIVPTQSGLISISGVSITDMFLKRQHDFNKVLQVFSLSKEI